MHSSNCHRKHSVHRLNFVVFIHVKWLFVLGILNITVPMSDPTSGCCTTLPSLLHCSAFSGDTATCRPVLSSEDEQRLADGSESKAGYVEGSIQNPGAQQQPEQNGKPELRSSDGAAPRQPKLIGTYYSILGRTSVDIIKTSGYKVSALQVGAL